MRGQLITDVVPRSRAIPVRESVKEEMSESRYQLGPFRLQPFFSLQEIGYNSNVYGTEDDHVDDYTASVGLGFRYIAPVGSKLFVRGQIAPTYIWYADLDERRQLGGSYSTSFLALFNRLSVEVSGLTGQIVRVVNSESERTALVGDDRVFARVEVDLLQRLSIFGAVEAQSYDHDARDDRDVDVVDVRELDRSDRAARVGLRYRWSSYLDFTAGIERTRSEFDLESIERDHETEAYLFGVHYTQPALYVNLSGSIREAKSLSGSEFIEYTKPTGSYFISYAFPRALEIQGYGGQRVAPALFSDSPYFTERRFGAAANFQLSQRFGVRTYAETGANEYPRDPLPESDTLQRADDVQVLGLALSTRLYRNVTLVIDASRNVYDSNLSGRDREVFRVASGLSFRGFFGGRQ